MKHKIKNPGKVAVVTLGCSKNVVDSERILGSLRANGIKTTQDARQANTLVINTCGFIKPAKQESIQAIMEAVGLKQNGVIRNIIVTGCLSERYNSELEEQIEGVDAFLGINAEKDVLGLLSAGQISELHGERELTTPKHYAYLKIAEGCDHRCSFCAIPVIRGKHISRPKEEILAEAKQLVANGTKEIIVIAQDTTYYGMDLYKKRMLPELLDALASETDARWIRLMYTYPNDFPDGILDVMARHENICNYIDIPFQHISSRILKSMRRSFTANDTRDLIERIRLKVPEAVIRSTFITGYPNESEAEFRELHDFIQEAKLDRVGVFTYSHEENTPAFDENDNIPEEVKIERRNKLMELQQSISLEKNEAMIGREIEVVIDEIDKNTAFCRSQSDAPEVDNCIIVRNAANVAEGDTRKVVITKAEPYDLYAKLAK